MPRDITVVVAITAVSDGTAILVDVREAGRPHSTRGPIQTQLSRAFPEVVHWRWPQHLPPRRDGPASEMLHNH